MLNELQKATYAAMTCARTVDYLIHQIKIDRSTEPGERWVNVPVHIGRLAWVTSLEFREAFIFTIVILILVFRPEGLVRGRA